MCTFSLIRPLLAGWLAGWLTGWLAKMRLFSFLAKKLVDKKKYKNNNFF